MSENSREDLLEILSALDINDRGKKRFSFPRNVDQSYTIIAGLSGKDFLFYIFPALGFSALFFIIPPYSSLGFWVIKAFIAIIFFSIAFIMALVRPVQNRPNIRMVDFIKNYKLYTSRQKVFYIKKKDKENLYGTDD